MGNAKTAEIKKKLKAISIAVFISAIIIFTIVAVYAIVDYFGGRITKQEAVNILME